MPRRSKAVGGLQRKSRTLRRASSAIASGLPVCNRCDLRGRVLLLDWPAMCSPPVRSARGSSGAVASRMPSLRIALASHVGQESRSTRPTTKSLAPFSLDKMRKKSLLGRCVAARSMSDRRWKPRDRASEPNSHTSPAPYSFMRRLASPAATSLPRRARSASRRRSAFCASLQART